MYTNTQFRCDSRSIVAEAHHSTYTHTHAQTRRLLRVFNIEIYAWHIWCVCTLSIKVRLFHCIPLMWRSLTFVYKFIRNINMSEMCDLWFCLLYFSKQLCASSASSVTVNLCIRTKRGRHFRAISILSTHTQARIESTDRKIEQYLSVCHRSICYSRTHNVSISYHAMRWNGLKNW